GVRRGQGGHVGEMVLRDDEHVGGGLRVDIAEGQDPVGFQHRGRRDIAGHDGTEQAFSHGKILGLAARSRSAVPRVTVSRFAATPAITEGLSYPRAQWIFLIFGNPPAFPGGMPESRRRIWPAPPPGCVAGRYNRRLARWFADDVTSANGQRGGRPGDEGPEAVVLRDPHRGAEAAG